MSTEAIPALAFHVVLECSGVHAAVNEALLAAQPRGCRCPGGHGVQRTARNQPRPVDLQGAAVARAFRFNDEIDRAIELLDQNPAIESVITHELPANQALEALTTAKDSLSSGKVIISLRGDQE